MIFFKCPRGFSSLSKVLKLCVPILMINIYSFFFQWQTVTIRDKPSVQALNIKTFSKRSTALNHRLTERHFYLAAYFQSVMYLELPERVERSLTLMNWSHPL